MEAIFPGCAKHAEMDGGILVAREADVADFAGLACVGERFQSATGRKETIGIFHADDFVELEQVEVAGLQALEGFVKLLGGCLLGAAVHFRH
jgi:hypothetical protein